MSEREPFRFVEKIGVSTLIPSRWDMFANNLEYKEEGEIIYKKESRDFNLKLIYVNTVR